MTTWATLDSPLAAKPRGRFAAGPPKADAACQGDGDGTGGIYGYTDTRSTPDVLIAYGPNNPVNEYESIDSESLMHDAAGNLVLDERGLGYEHDFDNRLVRVWRGVPLELAAEFVYDALGRRIARTLVLPGGGQEATVYCCDGQNVLAEYDGEGGFVGYFVNGPQYIDERVLVHEAAGYRYNAYGQPTGVTSDNPYYFTGRRLDVIPVASPGSPVVLYDYRARTYDPVHGRFLSRDPLPYVDGMNLYQYSRSSPGVHVDPTGTTTSRGLVHGSATQPAASPNPGKQLPPITGPAPKKVGRCCSLCNKTEGLDAKVLDMITQGRLKETDNDSTNAFKHCFATCTSAKTCGLACARNFWQGREWNDIQGTDEAKKAAATMDWLNNEAGLSLASQQGYTGCYSGCKQALESGRLYCNRDGSVEPCNRPK